MTIEATRLALFEACGPVTTVAPITPEQIAATIARIHAAEEAFDAAITAARDEHIQNTPVPFPEYR